MRRNKPYVTKEICKSENCDHFAMSNLGGLCQPCYTYLRNGGKIYDLPKVGEIAYAENGNVICHICGKAYPKLGGHIAYFHHMKVTEYRKKFGLIRGKRLSHPVYVRKMHDKQLPYLDVVVTENLLKKGEATRFNREHGNIPTLPTVAWQGRCKGCAFQQGEWCNAQHQECRTIIGCKHKEEKV